MLSPHSYFSCHSLATSVCCSRRFPLKICWIQIQLKRERKKYSKQSSLLCPAQWGSRFGTWPRRSLAITPLPWFPSPTNFKGQSLDDSMGWAGPPTVRMNSPSSYNRHFVHFLIWPSFFPGITFLQSLLNGQGPTWACLWHAWLEEKKHPGQWNSPG